MNHSKQNEIEKSHAAENIFNAASEISIWLDSYSEIFSDFDSRGYTERSVSDDFLAEVRKVCDEKAGDIICLKLLIDRSIRSGETEEIIIQRLQNYFNQRFDSIQKELSINKRNGILFILLGVCLMIGASYLSFLKPDEFYIHALLILFEPAGWFFLWSGLDHLIYLSKNKTKERSYHFKMAKATIEFADRG